MCEEKYQTATGRDSERRGTRDHIANLEMDHGTPSANITKHLYMCFIDYNKAFDCVDYALIWNTLSRMGFQEHITHLLDRLYREQTDIVRTEFIDKEPFPIGKGVRQGVAYCPLCCSTRICWADYAEQQVYRNLKAESELRGGPFHEPLKTLAKNTA